MATDWSRIVNFYAGPQSQPIQIDWQATGIGDPRTLSGRAYQDEGRIEYSPAVLEQLRALDPRRPNMEGVKALVTLIHEALHQRKSPGGWHVPENWPEGVPYPGSDGFRTWDDEHQAQALAANLVPDALQRFFGVRFDSPLGQRYWRMARDAVRQWGYGMNPSDPLGAPTQEWQDALRANGQLGPGFVRNL